MRLILFFIALATAFGQTGPDPNAVLEKARVRLQAMAQNLEKYVCVETVNRSYYQRVVSRTAPPRTEADPACGPGADSSSASSGPHQLEGTDRVRLEVTVTGGRELHSWPGATRFESRDVDNLIRDGPVSTGAFGSYLASVFSQPGVSFQFAGTHSENGKTVLEYRYRVPIQSSRYEVRVAASWHPAGFEGDFWLDPQTLELERLTIKTDELPSGATFCQAATTLEYQRVHIGDSDLLLPRQSDLEIVLQDGRETRNVTTFDNCREYQAESEIVFSDAAPAGNTAAPGASRGIVTLPIGLPVTLALTAPIDSATAAAGDPVAAKVVKPVRRPGSSQDLIPAGATVYGRLRRVEHHLAGTPFFQISISFNRVDVNGALSPFEARREADPEEARDLGANLTMRETGVRFWGVGTFLFPTGKTHVVIPAGFESKWFTLATGTVRP